MTWDDFLTFWVSGINTPIPKEAAKAWYDWTSTIDTQKGKEAIFRVADRYHAERQRSNYVPAPTLIELKREYEQVCAEKNESNNGRKNTVGCDFCEHSAGVYVIDPGSNYPFEDFPPDPKTYEGYPYSCVVPCPVCVPYRNSELRDRIKQRCRPFSRRHELFKSR